MRKGLIKPVSPDEAPTHLLETRKTKLSHFVGGWKMDDKETLQIKGEMNVAWKKWDLQHFN